MCVSQVWENDSLPDVRSLGRSKIILGQLPLAHGDFGLPGGAAAGEAEAR